MEAEFKIPKEVQTTVDEYIWSNYPEFTALEFSALTQRLKQMWILIYIEHLLSSKHSAAYFHNDVSIRTSSYCALHTIKGYWF